MATTEPDERVHYVRDIEIYDDAEDVKTVRFIGDSKTVDVGITDDTIVEFVEAAEEVFKRIHTHMGDLHDILNDPSEDDEEDD
ncbi:hypothetical protein [Haloparvum sp. PAK95]|uniref:hypothetical protein n=1 Tax=Haloparvum sp. PAK95 TaxID=3418962 RepID=UPI003D2EB014